MQTELNKPIDPRFTHALGQVLDRLSSETDPRRIEQELACIGANALARLAARIGRNELAGKVALLACELMKTYDFDLVEWLPSRRAGRVTEEDVRCMEDWANEVEWYVVKETEWGPDRWELWTPGMSCRVTE